MLRINQRKKTQASVGNAVLGVPWDLMNFTDSRKATNCYFHKLVGDDAHIVPKSYMSLFACGESVRRGRRTLRICREFVRFQAATVGDGSPVSNIKKPVFPER